jgi:hypothetical protein
MVRCKAGGFLAMGPELAAPIFKRIDAPHQSVDHVPAHRRHSCTVAGPLRGTPVAMMWIARSPSRGCSAR